MTELETAITRMEAEADELVASRTPLEAQRQQLVKCESVLSCESVTGAENDCSDRAASCLMGCSNLSILQSA